MKSGWVFLSPITVLALLSLAGHTQSPDRSPEETRLLWQKVNACAGNSLYLYTRMHGEAVALTEIQDALALGPQGARLEDMRLIAGRLGVPSRAMQVDGGQLERAHTPFIAHLESAFNHAEVGGHFVVVMEVSDGEVVFIDGTTSQTVRQPRNEFEHLFTGAILERQRNSLRPWLLPALAAATVLAWWRWKK